MKSEGGVSLPEVTPRGRGCFSLRNNPSGGGSLLGKKTPITNTPCRYEMTHQGDGVFLNVGMFSDLKELYTVH